MPAWVDELDVVRLAQKYLKRCQRLSHGLLAVRVLGKRLAKEFTHAWIPVTDLLVRMVKPEDQLE